MARGAFGLGKFRVQEFTAEEMGGETRVELSMYLCIYYENIHMQMGLWSKWVDGKLGKVVKSGARYDRQCFCLFVSDVTVEGTAPRERVSGGDRLRRNSRLLEVVLFQSNSAIVVPSSCPAAFHPLRMYTFPSGCIPSSLAIFHTIWLPSILSGCLPSRPAVFHPV